MLARGWFGASAALMLFLAQMAAIGGPARADTTYLPWPGAVSCNFSDTAGYNGDSRFDPPWPAEDAWTMRRLTVTSAATITAAQAYVDWDPGSAPTVVDVRANDGTVATSGWTIVGTLTQQSFVPTGSDFTATYTGSVTLAPGTYWIGLRGITGAEPAQQICLANPGDAQSPWSVNTSTAPSWYSTSDGGASYISGTNTFVPFISLSTTTTPTPTLAATPPPTYTLTLDPGAGATCASPKASAISGTWLSLPGARDCTASATRQSASLLGWSTSPLFPVARAKIQTENGWGAFDGPIDGVRMIFIPAGKATFVSGDNTLYGIWAS